MNSHFDLIAQAIQQQQQRLLDLQEENRELRRQLADLRAGRGIFVAIGGQLFAPATDTLAISSPQQNTVVTPSEPRVVETPAATAIEQAPTEKEDTAPRPVAQLPQQEEQRAPFLEEIMIDEFAAAATSPMAVWNGPTKTKKLEEQTEEEKAALRRELMGSFLLE